MLLLSVSAGWVELLRQSLPRPVIRWCSLDKGKEKDIKDYLHTHDEVRYPVRGEGYEKLTNETYTVRNTLEEDARPIRDKSTAVIGEGIGGEEVIGERKHIVITLMILRFVPKQLKSMGKKKSLKI